ncbi:MAG: sulfurtransferase TusA family protein [Spirochaetaceae bacterium]
MADQQADVKKELKLENEVCPYTFVKSKLAIEQLKHGEVLRIHLGNSESAANVPRSLDLEGHEVLQVERVEPNHWVVDVKHA